MPVRFGLLGDIEAYVDDDPVALGHARQRSVLAALLADVNRSVPTDQLVERVWAGSPPYRAHRSLASYLSRLRKLLAGAGDVEIARTSGGYVLRAEPDSVDLHRFRTTIEQARAQQDLALFDQALELWRGDAFADVDTPWCNEMREVLAAERLAAELDRTDVALRLGRHNAVLAGAAARAAAHPYDERIAAQLMLTLYRAGRQTDALEHYRQTRLRLADEFGTDPGAALQEQYQRILAADAGLELPRTLTSPRQLPAPPRWFVGRDAELGALTGAVDSHHGDGVRIVLLAGQGGIGKTSLALRWAHRNLARFPDGQLHVNLRGFDPSGTPMTSAVAVRRFLDALGVAPSAIPADEDGQVVLYRSLVAGKRLLVVLDNARDSAQVEPLLPGSESCTVLVTSRNRLPGLGVLGAHLVELTVFAEATARELLVCHLGAERIAEEPGAVDDLVRWCAGLPLAVSIVASRAAVQPGFPLEVLAKELGDTSARLDALDGGELNANLRAVFSWSHHALDAESAQAFELLGLAPGPDISLAAAAALTGIGLPRLRSVLRVLVSAYLLHEHVPGRYRMHDLLRLYVDELAGADTRRAALRRVTDFYLHTARTAAQLLRPERPSIDLDPPSTGCTPFPLTHQAEAMAWFETEHACLFAALNAGVDRDAHDSVWKLAWLLSAFHTRRGHLLDDLVAWRAGVEAAQQLDEPPVLAVSSLYFGTACARVGEHTEAAEYLLGARALAEQSGALNVLADVHRALGWVRELQGDHRRALPHAHRALRVFRAAGNPMREADSLNSVGWLYAKLGRHERALVCCERALVLCRELGHRRGEALTLDSLGYIAQERGQHEAALRHYQEALTLVRATDDPYDEAGILAGLGDAHQALGHHDKARAAWRTAFDLYQVQHRTRDAEELRRKFAPVR